MELHLFTTVCIFSRILMTHQTHSTCTQFLDLLSLFVSYEFRLALKEMSYQIMMRRVVIHVSLVFSSELSDHFFVPSTGASDVSMSDVPGAKRQGGL